VNFTSPQQGSSVNDTGPGHQLNDTDAPENVCSKHYRSPLHSVATPAALCLSATLLQPYVCLPRSCSPLSARNAPAR